MKKRIWIVTLLVMSTILAACGGGKVTTDEGYELVDEGKFTFASSGEFAPFSVTDGNGNMTGFDIEVAEAIAAELGLEPEQNKYTFASIVEGVKNGRFDAAVASHTITEERLEEVDFSTPYYYSGAQIFVRPDSDIETLEDLEGKEIAVSRGSTYADLVADVSDNIKNYDSDVVALESLNNGRHDAVVTDFVTGREAIGKGMELEGRELLERSEQAIAVAKGNEKLLEEINKALETLRENGKLAEISEKYFGEDITSDPDE
ncbi:Cystine-binding periplasmic protein precursor [Bacillus sp. THAF10]|uniref:transporter substrate-binding domain-containing protein n=1 Tax=Bacillus sp. THAF10 TaxID=2587848 RepID=UPI0012AAB70D|nr:transporter substrate-binding domain-containing protein [Bacillus sp. THAF10]QFT90089.1 Cystine-binding periplasmic protein precursor [Bacillus sp. THAF10]